MDRDFSSYLKMVKYRFCHEPKEGTGSRLGVEGALSTMQSEMIEYAVIIYGM